MSLVRLKANPKKVRVGVRRDGVCWTVTLTSLSDPSYPDSIIVTRYSVEYALHEALCQAEDIGMPGIDMGMGWAYEHPQHPENA